MNNFFQVNQNSYTFSYPPLLERANIRGFTAVDELLVAAFPPEEWQNKRLLVLGDSFGALAMAYANSQLFVYTDSDQSRVATEQNALENGVSFADISWLRRGDSLSESIDLILIKCPKSLAELRQFLRVVVEASTAQCAVAIGAMQKHMPEGYYNVLYQYAQDVASRKSEKKARIATLHGLKQPENSVSEKTELRFGGFTFPMFKTVFSAGKADLGSQFLLENLPDISQTDCVLDLGCGFGLLGVHVANTAKKVVFVDDSADAISSAQESCAANGIENAAFVQTHNLAGVEEDSIDTILCNPPFHLNHVVTEDVAKALFVEAQKVLKIGGQMCVVLNRHLKYKALLGQLFTSVELVAENTQFKILCAKL